MHFISKSLKKDYAELIMKQHTGWHYFRAFRNGRSILICIIWNELPYPCLQNATLDYNAMRDGQTLVIFGLFSFRKKYFLTKKAKNEDHIDKSGTHKKYYTSMCGVGIFSLWNNGA